MFSTWRVPAIAERSKDISSRAAAVRGAIALTSESYLLPFRCVSMGVLCTRRTAIGVPQMVHVDVYFSSHETTFNDLNRINPRKPHAKRLAEAQNHCISPAFFSNRPMKTTG